MNIITVEDKRPCTRSLFCCSQMIPIGNAECSVRDLLQSPNFHVRVDIR